MSSPSLTIFDTHLSMLLPCNPEALARVVVWGIFFNESGVTTQLPKLNMLAAEFRRHNWWKCGKGFCSSGEGCLACRSEGMSGRIRKNIVVIVISCGDECKLFCLVDLVALGRHSGGPGCVIRRKCQWKTDNQREDWRTGICGVAVSEEASGVKGALSAR